MINIDKESNPCEEYIQGIELLYEKTRLIGYSNLAHIAQKIIRHREATQILAEELSEVLQILQVGDIHQKETLRHEYQRTEKELANIFLHTSDYVRATAYIHGVGSQEYTSLFLPPCYLSHHARQEEPDKE